MLVVRKPPLEQIHSDGVLSFQFERLSKIAKELLPLVKNFWQEFPHKFLELDINWERAIELDLIGLLHVLTARDGEALVGFIINEVSYPVLFSSSKCATSLAIYLDEAYRVGWNGYNLLKKNEKGMRLLECKLVQVGIPSPELLPILKRLKYQQNEYGAIKVLNDG